MEIKSIFISEKQAGLLIKEELLKVYPELEVIVNDGKLTFLPHTDAYIGFGPILDFDKHHYKWIHCLAAGVDRFTQSINIPKETILTRTINPNVAYQIAYFCLSYILAIENNLFAYYDSQKNKLWDKKLAKHFFSNKKVLIFGTGEIGKKIAIILKSIGFTVLGVSRSGQKQDSFDKVYPVSNFDEVLKDIDWIINIMPLTIETTYFFNKDFFSKLSNVSFINVGRGKSVNEQDLLDSLENGNINYAVLDVQEIEPLPENSPLWEHKKVFITPHIAGGPDFIMASKTIPIILQKIKNNEEINCQVDLIKQY